MANCPSCGSTHIALKQETNVNWGRAVAGWALFGVVGGAVGAVTGDDRTANACLDCGSSWKARELQIALQTVKNATDVTLDLAKESNRLYLNAFLSELGPSIWQVSEAEKKAEKIISDAQKKENASASAGCSAGCVILIIVLFAAPSLFINLTFWLTIISFTAFFVWIGVLADKGNKQKVEAEKAVAMREAERVKYEAGKIWMSKVEEFKRNHPL